MIEEVFVFDLLFVVRVNLLEVGVKVVKVVDYVGVGIVEFFFDGESGIYFMEMNIRF